jgi:hypothetical protein
MQEGQTDSGGGTQRRTLRAMGITMIGVVISVATTVGFGVPGPVWVRIAAGVLVAIVLLVAIKLGTAQGSRGAVARAADWMTGT